MYMATAILLASLIDTIVLFVAMYSVLKFAGYVILRILDRKIRRNK